MGKRIFRFIKFSASSIISALIDLGAFHVLSKLPTSITSWHIVIATILARIISSLFNYIVNKKVVFEHKGEVAKTGVGFAILSILKLALSALFVTIIVRGTGWAETPVKAVVDFFLFFFNYVVQKVIIFNPDKNNSAD